MSNVLIVTVKLNLNHLAFSSIGSSIRASQVFASYRGSIIIMEKDATANGWTDRFEAGLANPVIFRKMINDAMTDTSMDCKALKQLKLIVQSASPPASGEAGVAPTQKLNARFLMHAILGLEQVVLRGSNLR